MHDLNLTDCKFNSNPYWVTPLQGRNPVPYLTHDLFDQSGYDLSYVERLFAEVNGAYTEHHKLHRVALRKPWMTQESKNEGAVLNHSLLFERKGYDGEALEQLKRWAKQQPVFYKMVNIKPKWGLDFSMDYYDHEGNTFEVLHWEYDGFDFNEIEDKKQEIEQRLISIDWDDAAKEILKHKDKWYNLDFFKQSDYKCNFFGIGSERWKMVVWN